ncbi:hypothetical protein A3860_11165 [Niastella vici]|uniref:Alpha-galactosidase n=2 Tax=Niastella vici TaxID=1703345 RepID=A0A1V9FFQ4_9BACT|nr:hypothetical protein A3860_11165 [Niastella vici]
MCLTTVAAMGAPVGENDTLVTIPFGKNNVLKVNLKRGTWDVLCNGKPVITDACATYKGRKIITSNNAGAGKYAAGGDGHGFGIGKQNIHSVTWVSEGMRVTQTFILKPGRDFFITWVSVAGPEAAANYISPMSNGTVIVKDTGDNRALFVPFDNDMWVRYNAQPVAQASFTGSEVTAIYNNDTYRGLVIGSLEHDSWKTGITVQHTANNAVSVTAFGGLTDGNLTHDKIPHGAVAIGDTNCTSPCIMVGMFSDWRMGMEQYATLSTAFNEQVIAPWKKATPMGWNSWGALQTKLTLDKAKGVIDFFSDSCNRFRNADSTLYIDLDSFWDNLVKGGLDGDVTQLQTFVQYCKSKHVKPGVYWAPFTDWGKNDRKMEGSNYTYAQAWLKQNGKPVEVDGALALDATHPGTKARIAWYLGHLKKLGFEMIKIDFLGHGALESDHFYDASITTGMQAYRMGMEYVDSVLDNSMLVYAAISPTMATAPYVHMRRIACDAFSAIDNTEYTLNSTGYGWWQSHLYNYVDADHVVFNRESEGANRARFAAALVTGTLITGDDYSEQGPWSKAAARWLQNKDLLNIIKDGHSFRPLEANTNNKGVELFVKTVGVKTYVALFNFSNSARAYAISLARLGLNDKMKLQATALFSGSKSTWAAPVKITVPPSDAMIYVITSGGK